MQTYVTLGEDEKGVQTFSVRASREQGTLEHTRSIILKQIQGKRGAKVWIESK